MITGKGFYTWNLKDTEGGDPDSLARVAGEAGLSHVLIKIADGCFSFNEVIGKPVVLDYIAALRKAGVDVLGWHYVYGDYPTQEADIAIKRMKELDLDVYVIDAETEYKYKTSQAVAFVNRVRAALPGVTIGLSSFRFPTLHREFPWTEFLSRVDFNMPQVYWVLGSNPGAQLKRCVEEFKAYPIRPIIPTGSAYVDNANIDHATGAYWKPTPGQVQEFMTTCAELGLTGYNFWEWANTRKHLPDVWDVIAGPVDTEYPPVVVPEPEPEPEPVYKQVRMGKVVSPSGLNVRSLPAYPSPPVWFLLKKGDQVEILEEITTSDGSIWWRIGQRQYVAHYWKSPTDGKFHVFAEYI